MDYQYLGDKRIRTLGCHETCQVLTEVFPVVGPRSVDKFVNYCREPEDHFCFLIRKTIFSHLRSMVYLAKQKWIHDPEMIIKCGKSYQMAV